MLAEAVRDKQAPNRHTNQFMFKKSIFLSTLCFLAASAAQAAVTVTNSAEVVSDRTQGTAGVATFNATVSGWSLNGGNAVAVFFTAEAGDEFSATYGGQPMNLVEISDGGSPAHYAAIAYLIDPDVTVGDIELSSLYIGGGGSNRLSTEYSILSLGGVGGVAGSNVRTGSGDLIYTTTEDGGYVLAAAEVNKYQGPAPTVSGNPDSFLAQGPYDGNHAVIHAHGDVATAGTYADSYSGSDVAVTLAFNGGGSPPPPLALSIAPAETGYDFAWNSLQGKIYDLVSSRDLSGTVETWPVYDPDGEGGAAPFEDIECAGRSFTDKGTPGEVLSSLHGFES